MESTRLEDAEALRNLLDDVEILEREARGLLDAAGRLTHTVRHYCRASLGDGPADPRHLLLELGAALERCAAIDARRAGMEDAVGSLGFTAVPNPSPHPAIQARAEIALRERLAARRGAEPA